MDCADAKEWRYFHEKLKTHQLTGRETPRDFLATYWQQKWQLSEDPTLKEFAELLLGAHRHIHTDDDVNNIITLLLQAENFARQAKEFMMTFSSNADNLPKRKFKKNKKKMADFAKVTDIMPLANVADVFKNFIDLKTLDNVEVVVLLQKLALDSLFPSHNFERFFSTPTLLEQHSPQLIHTEGNELRFNYPLLKQYFAAHFFISHLNNGLVVEFMMKTLFADVAHSGICLFLDYHFTSELPTIDVAAKFDKFLYENWLPGDKKFVAGFPDLNSLLCKLLESKFTAIFAFLFNLLKRRPQILRQILLDVGDNPLVKCGLSSLGPEVIADLITQLPKDVLQGHLVQTINEGGLVTIIERNDQRTLGYFISFIKNTFEPAQQLDFFTKKHGGVNVMLRTATPSHKGDIFKYLVKHLDEHVIAKLIHSKSEVRSTNLFHLALQYYSQTSLEFLVAFLKDRGVLKAQSLESNNLGITVVHKANQNENPDILPYLIDTILKFELSDQEFLEVLTRTDEYGCNILHMTLFYESIHLERIGKIFEIIQRNVDTITYQQMLLQRLETGENVLHLASKRGDLDIFRYVHGHLIEKVNAEVANEMLQSRCNENGNVVVLLTPTLEVSKSFFQLFEELLPPDVLKEFLLGEVVNHENILHIACQSGNFDNFKFLLDYLKKKLDPTDFQALLVSRNMYGSTILKLAVENPHYGFFRDLVDLIKPHMGVADFRNIVRARNVLGLTILHSASVGSNVLAFEDVVSVVKSELEHEEYTNMLTSRTYCDDNMIGLCWSRDKPSRGSFFKYMLKFLEEELGPDQVKKMLLYTDEDGKNILHHVSNVDVRTFTMVLEHLEAMFEAATVQRLLLELNHDGLSILNRLDFVEFYNVMRARVDVQPLLRAVNGEGDTIVHQAFLNPKAMTVLDRELGVTDVNRLLHMPDLLILACNFTENSVRDHSIMLQTIGMVAQRLGVAVLKEMALHKDADHINAFMHLCQGYLDRYEITEIFECLSNHVGLECFEKVITAVDSRSGQNLFFMLVTAGVQTFQHIVEYLTDKLGPVVVRTMLTASSKDTLKTPIVLAAQHEDSQVFAYLLTLFKSEMKVHELATLYRHRMNTELECNNNRQMQYWFSIAKQLTLDDSFGKKAEKEFLFAAAEHCDPIFIKEFARMFELDIVRSIAKWPSVLRHAVKNPSTLVLRIFFDAGSRKTESFRKCLKTIYRDGSLLHHALKCRNLVAVKYIVGVLQQQLTELDVKAVLVSTTKEGFNLIAQTVIMHDKVGFNLILALLKRHVDAASLRTMLMRCEEYANVLVYSVDIPSMVHFVHQKLIEELGIADTNSMLMQLNVADNDSNVLHRNFRSGQKFYMCYVMEFLGSVLDRKDINNMLGASTNYGNNIVHVAFINASGSTIEYIFQFLRENLGQEELKRLLCDETTHGSKVFHIVVKKTAVLSMGRIYDQLVREFGDQRVADDLLLADNRFGQNILYIAARMGLPKYFAYIVEFIRSKSDDECVKQMALRVDDNGENLFHAAARNPNAEIFPAAATFLRKYFDQSTVESLLLATARNRYNILHFTVRSDVALLPIYEFCVSMFGAQRVKRMLCAPAVHGNVLQIAARFGSSFRSLFSWLKTLLTVIEFRRLLTLNNRPGDTVFAATLFDHPEGLEEIVDCYIEEIGLDLLKIELSTPEFIHSALGQIKTVEAFDCLFVQLSRLLDARTILSRFLSFDPGSLGDGKQVVSKHLSVKIRELSFSVIVKEFREKVLHMTICTADAYTLEALLKYMEDEDSSMLEGALQWLLQNGDNIGHSVIRTKDMNMISQVFKCLEDWEVLSETILHQNAAGLNVVSLAAESGREEIFLLVLDRVAKFDVATRESLVPFIGASGPTIFHVIAQNFRNSVVNKAFGVLLNDMTDKAISTYFNMSKPTGLCLFHICILLGNCRSVRIVGHNNAAILQTTTKNRENVFHLAARSGSANMLVCMLEMTKEVLSSDGAKALLMAVDASGSNILHMVALRDDQKFMETSIDLLDPELGKDVVRNMVTAVNYLGHSVDKIVKFFENDV